MTRLTSGALLLVVLMALSGCGGKEGRAQEYLDRAQRSFDQEDYVKAELDAKNALQIEPNNAAAVRLMADLAEKQDKGREMFQFLMRTVELNPNDIDAHIKLGRLYVGAARLEEARSHADSALGVDPQNVDARILDATIMYREGDVEGSRAIAQEVLDTEPRSASALAFIASTYRESEPDKAVQLLSQAVDAEPNNQGLRKINIALLNQLGRVDDVESELRAAIGLFPDNNEYRYSLARFLATQGKSDEGVKELEQVIAANPDDMTARLFHAQYLGNQRSADAAESALQAYIAEDPEVSEYRFALGQVYVMTRKFAEASAVYQGIVDRDQRGPDGIRARNKLASLKMLNNDVEGSKALISAVLADEPANPEALLMQASLMLKDENASAAISDLRTILRDNPAHENARLLLGKAHAQSGELNLALEEYQRLVDAYPNNVEGRRDLATVLVQLRRWEEVRSLLEVGVSKNPNDLQMTRLLIDTYMRQEEWDLADREVERVLANDPESPMGHYVKARILQSQGQFEESVPAFKRALQYNPNAIENITGLIRSYVRMDDTATALTFLQEFSPANPENVQAISLWGEMLARSGRWDEAIAKNEEAISRNPKWLPAYRNLIGVHMRQGDLTKADATIGRGLSEVPGNPDLQMMRATLFEQQDRWSSAIAIYEDLLAKNSALDIAANNYVALVADHRNDPASLEKALGFAQRFRNTDNPIFQDTLGWLLYRMGDYGDALPLLEAAVSKAGQLQQLRYHLGMTYYHLDQLENARQELESAVENPSAQYEGFDEAKATLELL